MIRRVLPTLALGVVLCANSAPAKSVMLIEFEITYPNGTTTRMTVTDPHFVPLDLPSGRAGLYMTVNPADHSSVGVVFYRVEFTGTDVLVLGPLEREQKRTELGRDTMNIGGEAILSKTASPFQIRVIKVVHEER